MSISIILTVIVMALGALAIKLACKFLSSHDEQGNQPGFQSMNSDCLIDWFNEIIEIEDFSEQRKAMKEFRKAAIANYESRLMRANITNLPKNVTMLRSLNAHRQKGSE